MTFLIIFTAEEIKELWQEYENNASLEANLVKDFDKVWITNFLVIFSKITRSFTSWVYYFFSWSNFVSS